MADYLITGDTDDEIPTPQAWEDATTEMADDVITRETDDEKRARVLAEIAHLHQVSLHAEVLEKVAILWAHHVGVDKDEIVRQSSMGRSKIYKELPKTQEFIEKLRTDAQLDRTDRGEVAVCNLCDGEFMAKSFERRWTYPAMYWHWQRSHGWFPKRKGTPPLSDEFLDELRDDFALEWVAESQQSAVVDIEAARSVYPDLWETAIGTRLETVLEEVAQRQDDELRSLRHDIQRREDQRAALSEIRAHRVRAEKSILILALSKAKSLQIPASTIATVMGKTAKVVGKMQAEGDEFVEACGRFFEEALGLRPMDPVREPEIVRKVDHLVVSYYSDGKVAVDCSDCQLGISGGLAGDDWMARTMHQHWRVMHSTPCDSEAEYEERRAGDPLTWLMEVQDDGDAQGEPDEDG